MIGIHQIPEKHKGCRFFGSPCAFGCTFLCAVLLHKSVPAEYFKKGGDFVHILLFFTGLAIFLLFVLFIPDIFPLCSCCHRKKLRPFIKIHKAVSIHPGYRGSRSVCRKCSEKFRIDDLSDLDRVIRMRRKSIYSAEDDWFS